MRNLSLMNFTLIGEFSIYKKYNWPIIFQAHIIFHKIYDNFQK